MGEFSIWHLIILLVVVMLVFGTGKLPKVAGDLAHGIKNFKQAMRETPDTPKQNTSAESKAPAAAEPPALAATGEENRKTASAVRTEEPVGHG